MPGSSFGESLRLTTFGESHGPAMGAVVDGMPADSPSLLRSFRRRWIGVAPGG